jgi:hypothetical protein
VIIMPMGGSNKRLIEGRRIASLPAVTMQVEEK